MTPTEVEAKLAEIRAGGEWRDYATDAPAEAGIYEWSVPSARCKDLRVRTIAHHRKRGAGYKDVLSPEFDYWDGYKVTVPAGTQWRPAPEGTKLATYHQEFVCAEGVEITPCPFCRRVPKLKGIERGSFGGVVITADAHRFNSWWLECCSWAKSPHYSDPRDLAEARSGLLAHVESLKAERDQAVGAWQDISTAPKDGTWIELYRPPAEFGRWECRIVARWHLFEDGEATWAWPDEMYDLETDEERERADELVNSGSCYEDAENFTHWRPLPAPPAAGATDA